MDSEKKVLLISRGSMFMVGAVEKSLKGAGFDIVRADPSMEDMNGKKDEADIILFYLGNYLDDVVKDLVFLKDLVVGGEKTLCVIGDEDELKTFFEYIPEELVSEKFLRPLDVAAVTASLDAIAIANETLRESAMQKKQILLVDDDGAYLKMMREWLSSEYRVVMVNSGMQAITWLATGRPDLILLDYEMPVTDGPQVLEMIKSESATADIPVMFLTGKGDKASVMKVLALKPAGYLLKTMDRKAILDAVADFFAKRDKKA